MERPKGVTVFAIIEILAGLLSLIGGLFVFLGVAALDFIGLVNTITFDIWTVTVTLLGMTLGLLSLISGIGLLMMKKWSRFLVMTVAIFVILLGITKAVESFITFGLAGIFSLVVFFVSLVYNGILLWYFKKEEVHHHFDNHHEEQKAAAGEEASQVEIKDQETVHQQ